MPKETLLKKTFKESDVQRIRNIVAKKYGDATISQVGYQRTTSDHNEGDVWEEDGRTWTIKDGLKETFTKLDDVKALLRIPLSCPVCKGSMKTRFDKIMYPIHKRCFNCVTEYESQLKREGKYEAYMQNIIRANMRTDFYEAEQFIEAMASSQKEQVICENGDIQDLDGDINMEKLVESMKKELQEVKERFLA